MAEQAESPNAEPNANRPRLVRRCWICHEDVEATYEEPGLLDAIRGHRPRPSYISEDGDRLINPCICRGTVKYVHEGCLKTWQNYNPDAWRCSRCHYEYRTARMTWAQRLRSPIVTFVITNLILWITVFLLGFIADPILNLWIDPVGTIADTVTSGHIHIDDDDLSEMTHLRWPLHFLKGFFSLGLLGFMKLFFVMSPWQWWNLRSGTTGIIGGGGRRRAGTGRDRVENVNLALVLIGVATFLYVSLIFRFIIYIIAVLTEFRQFGQPRESGPGRPSTERVKGF